MRCLLPLLLASYAFAFPVDDQVVLNIPSIGKSKLQKWFEEGRQYVEQHGLLYELVSLPALPQYQLRITEPELCDPSVKQYSGYLDVSEDKHLFFWFFESRASPETDPVILWLNGGPGCSSSAGLLFELGPCTVTKKGTNTTLNPYSWNNNANIIFLDQPVNVGFSYTDSGKTVNNSPDAGVDVHAFLQLFFNRFSKYAKLPFHLAAESYGGTYGPNIASVIYRENKRLSVAPVPGLDRINLASLVLANGLTDPYIQMGSVADYVCDGPYPVYSDPNGPECSALRAKIPTCQRLIKSCYDFNSRLICVPAVLYCNAQIVAPVLQTGVNPYDVRRDCNKAENGDLCYKEMGWVENWMNRPAVKAALGVDPSRELEACNTAVNQEFALQGDGVKNSAKLLPELIEDGLRLLVYAGHADAMCNYMGNERWVDNLDTSFKEEFSAAKSIPWVLTQTGEQAGEVRSAGGYGLSAGNITFVNVYNAGHMVPFDVPEAALDLITRWLANKSLS